MKKSEELKHVLEKVISHLSESDESDWSPLTPTEVINKLQNQIDMINNNHSINKDLLRLEFAPTSTIQEIAMANGWSDEFLELSAKFDKLISWF